MTDDGQRLAVVETKVEVNVRRLDGLEGDVAELTRDLQDARLELRSATDEIKAISRDIKASGRRNMWAIGITLSAVNLVVDAGVLLYLH